jgi:intein/homing endonuclease/Rad3-related DNA helicase
VKSIFKNVRKTGKKKLFKLKTRTGREIIASENHPFLTINSEGTAWVSLDKLNKKSYICLPNDLAIEHSESSLEDNKLKILGHLISEGKLSDKGGSPKYYQDKNITPLIRQDYVNALRETFPEGRIVDKHKTEVKINFDNKDTRFGTTNKLRLFVREFGLDGTKSGDKFVPSIIFNLPEKKIAIFLQALFSGDGCIYARKNTNQIIIEYDSISKRLIEDISILLTILGIQHTITTHKFRSKLEYNWRITISNHENAKKYIKKVGFLGEKQKLALELLPNCKKHKFTNIDKVPRILREYLKNKGYSFNELDRFLNYELIEKLRRDIGFKKIIKNKLTNTLCVFKQSKIDFLRSHLRKVNEYIKDKVISIICNKQIFWDKIKSIEFVKEDITYDLEVPEQHNFIANGIIVHNSAIALNIARQLGKTSIVVPVKGLQRQYEEDYTSKKYLIKQNGKKMKIAMITGRDNHDSIIEPGKSCADPFLPDTIKITEKNYMKLKEYYENNPFAKTKALPDLKLLKRISIAPTNPYWSPIVNANYEIPLRDAKKKKYKGLNNKEFIFYHRKQGCSYYDQYQSYIDADVIIFNAAKYKIETILDRKPETEVEIIDEADEFLDNFSTQEELNLTRLSNALQNISPDSPEAMEIIQGIQDLIKLEEKNKQALGIDENKLFEIKETQLEKIIKLLTRSREVEAEISFDELNYGNKALEVAYMFKELLDETYVTFRKYENALIASLVSTNLSKRFNEIISKNKTIILMSGTLHSQIVLKEIFGIEDFAFVEAETINPGTIEIQMTGKEFDCSYSKLKSMQNSKEKYLKALSECMEKAKKPTLIHVNAFEDLPSEQEKIQLGITNLLSKERLKQLQIDDKTGRLISLFKSKLSNELFTTKCSRGVDFPGDICNSIIFTKYPNPNVRGVFWKILEKTHPKYYWDFYRDKARREFLQRIYRAVRSKNDHVYILSPDVRVLNAVKELQLMNTKK